MNFEVIDGTDYIGENTWKMDLFSDSQGIACSSCQITLTPTAPVVRASVLALVLGVACR